MKAINLRTEYLKNPIGISFQHPRLSWNCEGDSCQTAYQVIAKCNNEVVWDSGIVYSQQMNAVYPYPLSSRERIEWFVRLWNEHNQIGENSCTAFFEMGLLKKEDFKAQWISGNYHVQKKKRYPVDYFKKEITIEKIKKARLYVTACGLYEVHLNQERVGNFVLAPGHTDYKKRIQMQAYDVTSLLKEGKNTIVVALADGWFRGSCGAWGRKNQYGKQTKLYFQLEIETELDQIIIGSDETWNWSNDGPILFADNQDGEVVDANKVPTFFKKARISQCSVIPTSSNNVEISEHEKLIGKNIIITPSGKKVLDFGQNIAGYISFTIHAHQGQKIFLRFGEMFDENGEFTQKNIQCRNKKGTIITPRQQIEYICKEGKNEYKTTFSIFGFQYVLIDTDVEWKKEDFTAIAVYSDMESTLEFTSSNELLNRFVEATRWSAKNNHADIPTDCPTRERHGWTGDAQIFCKTASFLFNYAPFARKYLNDMKDGQRKNGNYRQISPKGGIDFYMNPMDGSAGWSDAGVFIPYRIYQQYGDIRILKENYESMKKYAHYKMKTLGKWYPTAACTGLHGKDKKCIANYGQSYGEWAEPNDIHITGFVDFARPHPEETTAYLVYMLEIMAEIATILHYDKDAEEYLACSEKAKKGYQKLVRCPKFSLETKRQAKLVRPLYFHLLDEKQEKFAREQLIKNLENYKWRLGTGFLSTPFILYVLENINIDYAYRLLENEEMPGWLFMTKMNANTIWESWEGTQALGGIASLDHYSKGAVVEWLISSMCGIHVLQNNEIEITPKPGGHFTFARAVYQSIYGKIISSWERRKGKIYYHVEIPTNTHATIKIGEHCYKIGSGCHDFTQIEQQKEF